MTFHERFHIVEVVGLTGCIFVDDGTRKQIEACAAGKELMICIDDIYGSEQTLWLDKIAAIHQSTPEIRQSYVEHNQGIDAEKKERGDFRED